MHAKVCVVDDTWACVGSDNFNLRSWTHDSELACAVLDSDDVFARDVRLRLLREHLDRAADGSEDDGLADPVTAVGEIISSAQALEAWHESGCGGRVRRAAAAARDRAGRSADPALGRTRVRVIYDPDGRS